ncbi:MAG TPA: type IIL restriction-modification enzyme MmeI [Thermomicrobiaceae bacterium]|nr:type IIL restriction-modification enzyme MmeI [Thermomicrobiaceae bacterium]
MWEPAARLTPQDFIAKWERAALSERASVQEHFLDLCHLLGQPTPAEADAQGAFYTFEKGVTKTGGGKGFADVWMRGHFAWEYKGKHANLDKAYQQLQLYREDLENPPLLVVCDIARYEIHTNFTGTKKTVHRFTNSELGDPDILHLLRALFTEPLSLKPETTTAQVTETAAEHLAGPAG